MTDAIFKLGKYYEEQKDYDNMKKCYINAIEKGHSYAMYKLGFYYEIQKDYDNMKKYYLMAIEKGDDFCKELLTNEMKEKCSSDTIKLFLKSVEKDKERLKTVIKLLDKFEEEKKKVYDKIYNLVLNELENNEDFSLFYQYITEKILKELYWYEKDLYTASTVILKNNLINYKNELLEYAKLKAIGIKNPSYLIINKEKEEKEKKHIEEYNKLLKEKEEKEKKHIEEYNKLLKEKEETNTLLKEQNQILIDNEIEAERYRQEERDRKEERDRQERQDRFERECDKFVKYFKS